MTPHELMTETNHYLIKGEKLNDEQSSKIVKLLLAARSSSRDRVSNISETDKRRLYPLFYVPPYNDGKKLKTILGQTPQTQILSANMYELEILRLLYILAPDNREAKNMIDETLKRLKTTCFGYMDDGVGECFDTSLIVLRFIAAAAQDETEWIRSRMENHNRHCRDKKRTWYSLWYYWLCLSELPGDIAGPEIERYRDEIRKCYTNKGYKHPLCPYILQNILSKYSEYF